METYEAGNHAYHATMPTDALRQFRDRLLETRAIGFETIRQAQIELGRQARQLIRDNGYESVAAEGFQAPSVIVSYTGDPDIKSGKKFAAAGMQIAAGVPLECGEPEGFSTFRIGLFGLDKLTQPESARWPIWPPPWSGCAGKITKAGTAGPLKSATLKKRQDPCSGPAAFLSEGIRECGHPPPF